MYRFISRVDTHLLEYAVLHSKRKYCYKFVTSVPDRVIGRLDILPTLCFQTAKYCAIGNLIFSYYKLFGKTEE